MNNISTFFAVLNDKEAIIEEKGLKQVSDTGEIEKIIDATIESAVLLLPKTKEE